MLAKVAVDVSDRCAQNIEVHRHIDDDAFDPTAEQIAVCGIKRDLRRTPVETAVGDATRLHSADVGC